MVKYGYSFIFDTPYALTLYLLSMTEEQVERTMFYAGHQISREIVARLPHAEVISVWEYGGLYRLRLACLWRNLTVLRWTRIFAQDHLMFASQLLCGCRYTYVEDAPGIYTISEGFKFEHADESTPWKRFVAWCRFGSVRHRYVGRNAQCVDRLVTDANDLKSKNLKGRGCRLIDMEQLWNSATEGKRRLITRILTGGEEFDELTVCRGHRAILLSQPMMHDCGLSETEMRDVYAPALETYRSLGVVVKPHPRDAFPFKKYFPWVTMLETKMPMQVLCVIGVRFDVAITICSTSVSSFGAKTEVCWLGTEVHPKIHDTYGDRKPPLGCRTVVACNSSKE